MSSKRIAAVVFVMGFVTLISFFILKGAGPASSQNLSASLAQSDKSDSNSQNLLSQNPIKWVENLVKGNFVEPTSTKIQAGDINSVNLTDLVGQTTFSQMRALDQSGQNPFENLDPNSVNSQAMIEQAISSIQNPNSLFTATIKDSDLKISSDNSKAAKGSYVNSIRVIATMFSDSKYVRSQDQLMESLNHDCLALGGISVNSELAVLFEKAANDYLNLSVPSDWLDLHKKIIVHFKEAQLIFGAIGNCVNDPIKGQLAVKALPDFMQRAGEVQIDLNIKMRQLNS